MPRRALFLDRDGIINLDLGYVHRRETFVFRDGIVPLCLKAQSLGMALVIVTNQAGIGRGLYTEADFHALTEWMLGVFAADGVRFAAVEYCPDHPVHGIGPYRRENPRRKPGPGMMHDAARAHGLDLATSAMLGDRATDMLAAAAAGIPTRILLPADAAEADAVPPGTIVITEGGLAAAARHLAPGATP